MVVVDPGWRRPGEAPRRLTLGFVVRPLWGRSDRIFSCPFGIAAVPQSLVQLYAHIVFSTKDRAPYLRDIDFRDRIHAYMAGICQNQGSPALRIGGVEDHVHILCRLSKTLNISTLVRELKRDTTNWIHDENAHLADFHWQNGYGAFSVSPSHIEALTFYIANQADHHRHESFQDEYRRLCKKYGIEFDERYAWD